MGKIVVTDDMVNVAIAEYYSEDITDDLRDYCENENIYNNMKAAIQAVFESIPTPVSDALRKQLDDDQNKAKEEYKKYFDMVNEERANNTQCKEEDIKSRMIKGFAECAEMKKDNPLYKALSEDMIDRERRAKFYKDNSAELLDVMMKTNPSENPNSSNHLGKPDSSKQSLLEYARASFPSYSEHPTATLLIISEYLEKHMQEKI